MLANLSATDAATSLGWQQAFEHELAAFERLLPGLLTERSGDYVAIYQGQVVDADPDELALARRVERKFHGEFVLVRKIAERPAEDHLPSPEAEPK